MFAGSAWHAIEVMAEADEATVHVDFGFLDLDVQVKAAPTGSIEASQDVLFVRVLASYSLE